MARKIWTHSTKVTSHTKEGFKALWRMLKVCGTEPESPPDVDDEAEIEEAADEDISRGAEISDCPEEWIFPGWIAFHMFVPRAHDEHKSPLFEVGDWVKNKRSAAGSGG
jgi:hypothetical protein